MKKILSLLLIVWSLQLVTHGFDLTFDSFSSWDPIRDKFSMVHFTLPSVAVNDFQGWFFWMPTKQLIPAVTINYNSTSRSCSKQVRWLYYTNAKWSRLWPLDQQSLNWLKLLDPNYNNLQINGALYTTCGASWSAEIYSIYGQINYTDTSAPVWLSGLWSLSAWLMYDIPNNAVDTTRWLFPTLQYFNNQTPLWYIYDNVWWIGFVWWPMAVAAHTWVIDLIKNNTGKNINNIFGFVPWTTNIQTVIWGTPYGLGWWISAWLDTIWNISVLGNVLLSRWWLEVGDRQSVLGNPNRSSSIVFSDVINTSDILNALRKNSDAACRWQQKIEQWGDIGTLVSWTPRTVCVYNNAGREEFDTALGSDEPFVIDLANTSDYDGVEIVVKGRNVVLQWSVPGKEYSINLFVDNWNVLLKNGDFAQEVVSWSLYSTNYAVFTAKWAMVNAFDDIAPIITTVASQTPWQTTYNIGQEWTNADTPVSARYLYDTLQTFSGAGNSWAASAINYWVYLRWNIFVNWLLMWWGTGDTPNWLVNKYYIHGRLASLNTALEPSTPRRNLINDVFGDTYWATLQSYINFSDIFAWQCLLNGYAADSNWVQTQQPCKVSNDAFKFNPLVLINTGVPSRLLP